MIVHPLFSELIRRHLPLAVVLTLVSSSLLASDRRTPSSNPSIALDAEKVIGGFEERVEDMFQRAAGKPLVRAKKMKPLGPGRGNYVRGYSYSMIGFAGRCLYLNEKIDEANAALVENAQHYLDNPKDINDRDSFHWHSEMVLRLIELYGTKGSLQPGRITYETETLILKPIWKYVQGYSKLEHADHTKSKTWHVFESENHHVMIFTLNWHFSKIAKDRPEYSSLHYEHGGTAAEHYEAWNNYFVTYCQERARKGMFIEMMNDGYNSCLIKGIYNFYDFGEPNVKQAAGMLLDVYWTYWAQEQIDGVQGGGRSRIYFTGALYHRGYGLGSDMAWLYFGIGKPANVSCSNMNPALSDYRPPVIVADIVLDVAGRGRYEVRQRPLGLGAPDNVSMHPYKLKTDAGGIVRYSFCDPAFIMGTTMTKARPKDDWTLISSQNRWQGVIFSGNDNARIVPIARPKDNRVTFNGHWSVQSKGTLITQKLEANEGGAEMLVWISKAGLSDPIKEDGIVFVESDNAYAAIRVIRSDYSLKEQSYLVSYTSHADKSPDGWVITPEEEYAPIILEVMSKKDVASFDEFKSKVKSCHLDMAGAKLLYKSIYNDDLTFDTSYAEAPLINEKEVSYDQGKALASPFLNADWNSGVVTITKGDRKTKLDFNKLTVKQHNERKVSKTISEKSEKEAFTKADNINWQEVFTDSCSDDWAKNWFLDGEVGTVQIDKEGMTLTAGPEFKNDAHHMVLWTKQSFEGDLKIEYDYTRLDNETRCVNILYIQATGSGTGPYKKDISEWNNLRSVPAMRTYYNNMNTYHISYAANPNDGEDRASYIRGRRYMPNLNGLKGTELKPDYYPERLFLTGVPHHIVVIKKDRELLMRVENDEQVYYCQMLNTDLPVITSGRIGLRHMFTRSARYQNIRISTPSEN